MIYLLSDKSVEGAVSLPMLDIRYLAPRIEWSAYNNLIITSGQALQALVALGNEWKEKNLFVVGEATAKRAKELGGKVYYRADGYGEDLAKAIIRSYPFGRYLYCRPRESAHDLVGMLRRSRIDANEVVVYETQCRSSAPEMTPEGNAVIIFTSPKIVRCFLQHFSWQPGWQAVCIGKTTAQALPKAITAHIPQKPLLEQAVALAVRLQN